MLPEQAASLDNFFSKLSLDATGKVLKLSREVAFRPGHTIFSYGDPATEFYILRKGVVALLVHLPLKGNQVIAHLGAGDVFSWSALVEPYMETATAKALTDVDVVAIEGAALMRAAHEDPRFGFEIYRALSGVIMQRLEVTRLQLLDVYAVN